jgi:hypothetical protein
MNKSKKMSKENIYTLPIIPVLQTSGEWRAYMDQEPDPAFTFNFERRPLAMGSDGKKNWTAEPERIKEPFAMRERFFAIRDKEDALRFFQEYGPLQLAKAWDVVAPPVKLSVVLDRRDFYLEALLNRSVDNFRRKYEGDELTEGMENIYLWQNLPMELVFHQPLQALVRCKDVEDALRATVFLSRLRSLPWQRCLRDDCGKPFEVASRRPKLYCTPECAHLQSVRNYNKRQQQGKSSESRHAKGRVRTK